MENDIIISLSSAKNPKEAEKIIQQHYPNWLILSLDGYSNDYPHLQKNWERLCSDLKVTPRKIVLVNEIVFGDEQTTLNKICEYMTTQGYVVRRSNEFIACSHCEKAIPSMEIWRLLKEKGFPVPNIWANKCTEC